MALDNLELAQDELYLARLPLCFVVGCALVVLATEEGPIRDVASAGLVAAKVISGDFAREVFGVLASLATSVFVVEANKLALRFGTILIVGGFVGNDIKLFVSVQGRFDVISDMSRSVLA